MITSPFQEISFPFYLSCWHRFTLLEIVKFSSFREGLLSGPSLKVSSKDCKDNVFSKGNDHVFNYLEPYSLKLLLACTLRQLMPRE